jgi:hypothetical protein
MIYPVTDSATPSIPVATAPEPLGYYATDPSGDVWLLAGTTPVFFWSRVFPRLTTATFTTHTEALSDALTNGWTVEAFESQGDILSV